VLLRRPAINWQYATGEIAIIVVGILLAITLDNCNDARINGRVEHEYLTRLGEDLRTDTATFAFVDRALSRKQAALALVDSVMSTRDQPLRDTISFLQAVVTASNFAWNQPRVRTTTFQELHSSGNLRLLRDEDLRAQVVRYYTSAEGDYLRIEGRRTRYGPLTYELIPRKAEFTLDSARARAQSGPVVHAIMRSDLRAAIMAERNLANFVGEMNAGLKRRSVELLERIEAQKKNARF
jgi:hypothetical protein